MTPKEKANELVQQFVVNMPLPFHIEDAKICAMITVDEMIGVYATAMHAMGIDKEIAETIPSPYLLQLKQEIKNL